MEDNKIKIRCPNDGSVLMVAYKTGMENAFVTCPVCKRRMPFKQFQLVVDAPESHTEYATEGSYNRVGALVDESRGNIYKLEQGKNVVGRKAPHSLAGIQLVCPPGNRMSREHLLIEVEGGGDRGYVHYASLNKEKVNDTYVGAVKLEYGDRVILRDGDIIRLPDVSVKFEIPNG